MITWFCYNNILGKNSKLQNTKNIFQAKSNDFRGVNSKSLIYIKGQSFIGSTQIPGQQIFN